MLRRLRLTRHAPTSDLSADTVAVLLAGWTADPPAGVERNGSFGGGFLELYDPDGPARLWRQHEAYLRAVARRWGWTPRFIGPDRVKRFSAEALMWEAQHGTFDAHGVPQLHVDEDED